MILFCFWKLTKCPTPELWEWNPTSSNFLNAEQLENSKKGFQVHQPTAPLCFLVALVTLFSFHRALIKLFLGDLKPAKIKEDLRWFMCPILESVSIVCVVYYGITHENTANLIMRYPPSYHHAHRLTVSPWHVFYPNMTMGDRQRQDK